MGSSVIGVGVTVVTVVTAVTIVTVVKDRIEIVLNTAVT
jgi:hypothetical protein